MSRHYVHLKEQPTGTKTGLAILARIFRYGNRLPTEEQVDLSRVLIRARGRVMADLILKGEVDHDEQAEQMKGFTQADALLTKAKDNKPISVDDVFEFIRRFGE